MVCFVAQVAVRATEVEYVYQDWPTMLQSSLLVTQSHKFLFHWYLNCCSFNIYTLSTFEKQASHLTVCELYSPNVRTATILMTMAQNVFGSIFVQTRHAARVRSC